MDNPWIVNLRFVSIVFHHDGTADAYVAVHGAGQSAGTLDDIYAGGDGHVYERRVPISAQMIGVIQREILAPLARDWATEALKRVASGDDTPS